MIPIMYAIVLVCIILHIHDIIHIHVLHAVINLLDRNIMNYAVEETKNIER